MYPGQGQRSQVKGLPALTLFSMTGYNSVCVSVTRTYISNEVLELIESSMAKATNRSPDHHAIYAKRQYEA